ncbi:hypothetical protein CKO15_06860 [Halorhodospira abdelmalekii]|uniref:alpha/beta hydrolase n=1 Tax=Halorhodospira abdelmalekii TaxID=421629 RepID=UPI0019055518|nr:alpha/beta fold hydrolase [Halorhodospira abdelmalekii]MBK1735008.1 hypothetical protein [Halorhodospira abdelmalekii]
MLMQSEWQVSGSAVAFVRGPCGLRLERCYEPARQPAIPHQAPLLFVPGAFSAAWCWQEHYLPYFAGLGYESYAMSVRGHGRSDGQSGLAGATLGDYVDDLAAVIDSLPRPPLLIGHSLGGLLVDRALRRGVAAAGAVLLAAVPPIGMGPAVLQSLVTHPAMLWQLGVLQGLGPSWVDVEQAQQALFAELPPREQVAAYMARMQPEAPMVLAGLGVPSWPWCGTFQAPVAVVGASEDAVVPSWMVEVNAWIHGVKPHWIESAGHAMMLEPGWMRSAEIVAKCLGTLGTEPNPRL